MNILKFGFWPWKYPSNWLKNIKQIFKNIKYAYQRVTRGYADCDVWDFDCYLSKLIAGGTKQLANTTHSYPGIYENPWEWENYLRGMANHFERLLELQSLEDLSSTKEIEEELEKGFDMLRRCYFDLWD